MSLNADLRSFALSGVDCAWLANVHCSQKELKSLQWLFCMRAQVVNIASSGKPILPLGLPLMARSHCCWHCWLHLCITSAKKKITPGEFWKHRLWCQHFDSEFCHFLNMRSWGKDWTSRNTHFQLLQWSGYNLPLKILKVKWENLH